MTGEIQTPSPRDCRAWAGQGGFFDLDGWGEASLASRCRTCQTNPGPSSARRTHPAAELGAAHRGTVYCVPYLAYPAVQVHAQCPGGLHRPHHLLSFPTTSTISIISIISFFCPQVTRCSQPAACMHACVRPWHTTACPELIEYWDNAPAYLGARYNLLISL